MSSSLLLLVLSVCIIIITISVVAFLFFISNVLVCFCTRGPPHQTSDVFFNISDVLILHPSPSPQQLWPWLRPPFNALWSCDQLCSWPCSLQPLSASSPSHSSPTGDTHEQIKPIQSHTNTTRLVSATHQRGAAALTPDLWRWAADPQLEDQTWWDALPMFPTVILLSCFTSPKIHRNRWSLCTEGSFPASYVQLQEKVCEPVFLHFLRLKDILIHPPPGFYRRGSDPNDDYVSSVSRGELQFMSGFNGARFCLVHSISGEQGTECRARR